MFAQLHECFGARVTANRLLRLAVLARVTWHPTESVREWTEAQYRWTAARLRRLAECPDQAQELLREAAAELSPDLAAHPPVALPTESADTRDQALTFLERIGEAGQAGRFAAGDCANVLLLLHPEARPAEVLGEFLRAPEMEKLKGFLCPKLPWAKSLSDEDRLRYEDTALNTLAELARVAARVPQDLRDLHPDLSFEWFRTAATAQELHDGRFGTPTASTIGERLAAASDERHRFRTLTLFRRWCRTGVIEAAPKAEAPDVTDTALAAFRGAFHAADSVASAWEQTFGPSGAYRICTRGRS